MEIRINHNLLEYQGQTVNIKATIQEKKNGNNSSSCIPSFSILIQFQISKHCFLKINIRMY